MNESTKNRTAAEIVAALKRHEIDDATITTTAAASVRWSNYGVPDVLEEFERGEVLDLQDWRPEGVMIRADGHDEVFASWRDLERLTAEDPKNTNTGAAEVAATKAATTRRYWRNISSIDMAVIKQLTCGDGVARNIGNGQCEIDEDTAEQLANVTRCGASGGFSGFIYYSETRDFFAAHRDEIAAALREQIAKGLFTDENGNAVSIIGAVMKFNSLKDEDPAQIDEMAARAFFGPLDDVTGGDLDTVANVCAWGALEDLAFGLDGQEVEDEGRAE